VRVFDNNVPRRICRTEVVEITGDWRKSLLNGFLIVFFAKCIWDDHVIKDEMGRAHSTHGKEK
jgi:hypothetical protein